MTAPIPARSWPHDGLHTRCLDIGETVPGDDVIMLRVKGMADGLLIHLGPDQADEIADSLKARAALMRGTQ